MSTMFGREEVAGGRSSGTGAPAGIVGSAATTRRQVQMTEARPNPRLMPDPFDEVIAKI
jgi:hypothetical protein